MTQTLTLFPGVTLGCRRDHRFKQGCLSIQLVRPMCRAEAAKNALLPAVLLRGCREYPDLRAITWKLDDLYGASVSALVRRVGDCQTTGLYCSFMEDRFALEGDEILAPMVAFLGKLLLDPVTAAGCFDEEYVRSEKRNLIATIESELNDKRAYTAGKLLETMCRADSFGVPRLGEVEDVAAITAEDLYRHYQTILRESPVELFYVGTAEAETVAALLRPLFAPFQGSRMAMPVQTPFVPGQETHQTEELEVAQGKLCMGFTTPITNREGDFAAMQVLNCIFGAGMTSKLFMNVREKLSLCYAIGSGYYGSKGIVLVSAGIDTEKEADARREILSQLEACRRGDITAEELEAAREAILSSLRGVHDSPGAMEGYYATAAISKPALSLDAYRREVAAMTQERVVAAANTIRLQASYFLKGVAPC